MPLDIMFAEAPKIESDVVSAVSNIQPEVNEAVNALEAAEPVVNTVIGVAAPEALPIVEGVESAVSTVASVVDAPNSPAKKKLRI